MKWFPMGDGSFDASDMGFQNDHIISKVKLYGKEDYINNIISELFSNQSDDGVLNLSSINTPLFGNNIDYTQPITAVLSDITIKQQKSLRGFQLDIELILGEAVYKSYTLELPPLKSLEYSFKGDTDWTFVTNRTYSNLNNGGSIDINRFEVDSGVFVGTFKFNYDDLGKLLSFNRIQRSTHFALPEISGVQYPFGVLHGATGLQAKLKSISNVSYISPQLFSAKLEFVQHF